MVATTQSRSVTDSSAPAVSTPATPSGISTAPSSTLSQRTPSTDLAARFWPSTVTASEARGTNSRGGSPSRSAVASDTMPASRPRTSCLTASP